MTLAARVAAAGADAGAAGSPKASSILAGAAGSLLIVLTATRAEADGPYAIAVCSARYESAVAPDADLAPVTSASNGRYWSAPSGTMMSDRRSPMAVCAGAKIDRYSVDPLRS